MTQDSNPRAKFGAAIAGLRPASDGTMHLRKDLENVFEPLLSGLKGLHDDAQAASPEFAVEISEPTFVEQSGIMKFDVVARVGENYGTVLEVGLKRNIARVAKKIDRGAIGFTGGGYNADKQLVALDDIQRFLAGTFEHFSA